MLLPALSRKAWGQAMATVATTSLNEVRPDVLSGTPRAGAIDRWIYVAMAVWFIVIVLVGFVPDSLGKIAAIEAGQRHPFPLIAHVHAVLMGAFMLLLLAQTLLVANGRIDGHRQLGIAGLVLAPAVIVAGFILAPTNYHLIWAAGQTGPLANREAALAVLPIVDNILLLQIRVGILFALFIAIALRARGVDAGMHKRMMILATAVPLPAAIDRMTWLPTTLPASPVAPDLYVLLAVLPMFLWDVMRNRSVHRAYWVWGGVYGAGAIAVNMLWDTPGWHAMARTIMGV